MDVKKLLGIRGAGQDAEGRRARAENQEAARRMLDEMMPAGPWEPFMTAAEIRLAGCVEPESRLLKLVHDTIRRRHMAALVELYAWEPGQPHDALVLAAGRVKELVELDAVMREIVRSAGEGLTTKARMEVREVR